MGKQPCCDKIGLKRGPWTIEEDQKLINFILNNGIHCWRLVPQLAGLMRCGKSCRLRWTNYLRPDLKRGALSQAEEDLIIQLHSRLGNRWSKIASHFPGRTDNEIKNHWNTRIKKRLKLLGMDPVTHKHTEQPGKCGLKEDQVSQLNSSQVEDKSVEATSMVDSIKENISTIGKTEDGVGLSSESSNMGLLHGNALPWESLDMKEMTAQANPSSSCSTSFSLEDSCFPSFVGGESTNYEDSNLGQSDAIDSFSSWDGLYHFEDMFSFGSYPRA